MSCVSFLTPAQREALRRHAESSEAYADTPSMHPVPEVTEGKLHRVRLMSKSSNPRIRESAALNQNCPPDVLDVLAGDPVDSVRECVARQPRASRDLLQRLSTDTSMRVRTWVAANPSCDDVLLNQLEDDGDETVRQVVRWARGWQRVDA